MLSQRWYGDDDSNGIGGLASSVERNPVESGRTQTRNSSSLGRIRSSVNASMADRAAGTRPFLWTDDFPEMQRRVQHGELAVTNHDPRKVPQGMIHHWVGAMFIPNVTLDQVMRVVNNYDSYSEMYKPLIRKTAVLERDGNTVKLNVLAVQKALSVTAAVETDEEIQVTRPAPNRVCIKADSVRMQEIADYGKLSEHPYPEARRPGYVWRAVIVQRLEERDGGVYVELETVSLSRGIPIEVRWLIKPLTDDLPRRMMTDILNATRDAVQQQAKADQVNKLDQEAIRK
jgi:hypothetical protein